MSLLALFLEGAGATKWLYSVISFNHFECRFTEKLNTDDFSYLHNLVIKVMQKYFIKEINYLAIAVI